MNTQILFAKSFVQVVMLIISLSSMMYPSTQAYGAEPVKIGVLAFRPKPQTLEQWQPLAAILKKAIPEHDFVVEALSYDEMDQAVASRKLDFVLTNSGHYVLLKKRNRFSSPLAPWLSLKMATQQLYLAGSFSLAQIKPMSTRCAISRARPLLS